MHRLTSSFILGYHGCDREVGESLLSGSTSFQPSQNDFDWLGPGVYFWQSNPRRGFEFAAEAMKRPGSKIKQPFVVGAVIDLGYCLDLTTSAGIEQIRTAYQSLVELFKMADRPLPRNSDDQLRRNLDCAVISLLHSILEQEKGGPIDTIKGVFTEGSPVYDGSGFREKTHTQIGVQNLACIKGVFRVPESELKGG